MIEREAEEPAAVKSIGAPSSGTVLAFTSDIHNTSNNTAANRLDTWLDKIAGIYGGINVMSFCGDMGGASLGESEFWTCTQSVMGVVSEEDLQAVYTTGNHEFYNGQFSSTSSNIKSQFKIGEEGLNGSNYRIYCLGTDNWNGSRDNYTTGQISTLSNYLNNAATANQQKIVLLWGHNHTVSDTHYDQIYAPGDSIEYSSGNSKELNFYYGAAGCMSDTEYGNGSAYVKGKGLVIQINSKNQLSFTYYDANGNNVTEGGTFTEQDPVDVTGVTIDQSTVKDVEVGKTITLKATVEPADATNKSVTWSSSDTSIATVDANGRVKGKAEGKATITVTAGDTGKKVVVSDSAEISVIPRSTEEQYYVITIDNYALSSNVSSEMTSNSSGYEYHGLQAVTYNADDPAPHDILWTLEEVDGVENGYYIKNYNGEYLSATYVRGSGSGYTGTLTVGDTQDVWIVNSGLEAWQGNGSYLKSTNASDNPRPADIYLTTRASNNSVDFFTVGSSSNYKTSTLVEPDEIVQPVAATGVTVEPTTLSIMVGRSAAVTATVLPENADDKNVTWSSSDENIATVDANGRVKGNAVGEAVITATTNDGGYTATCEVTVTPSTSPGVGYVITIGDYALSSEPSSDVLINSTNYRYEGLTGVPYDGNTEPTENILWLIEPTDGGYYIMSQDGQYLNAYYNATTNPTGCNAALKVDDTPDVWSFEGSLEDWVLSGSTLHSANANKYMTHEEGSTGTPLNLFTIRSTGESSSLIDPDNTAEERFIETNALTDNKDYIIGVTKDGSNIYAIENTTGTTSGDTGSATLTITPESGDEPAYIKTDNTGVVWRYTSSNKYLSNNTRYLSRGGSSGAYVPRASGSGSAVTYNSSNKRLSISYSSGYGGGTTYYITNTNGTFGLNTATNNAAQVRLFEKAKVFNFKYVVQFVSNGVNLYSNKYATGETPVYGGATPTREETDEYTFTFSGWSSDGGTTIYGPDDVLPAVTGPITYVAQFNRTPKERVHTVTFNTNGGTEIEAQTVNDGETATEPEAPTKEGCYEFAGWYADEDLTTTYDFGSAITDNITIYAKWNNHLFFNNGRK